MTRLLGLKLGLFYSKMMKKKTSANGTALQYRNTNPLVRDPDWQIDVSKTGFINEAGHCLVMQTRIGDRRVYMVFLDSAGRQSPVGDSNRVRNWILTGNQTAAR